LSRAPCFYVRLWYQAIDEEVYGRVDGHEEQGDRRHHHHPQRQEVVAAGLVVPVLPERVDAEELVKVQHDPESEEKKLKLSKPK